MASNLGCYFSVNAEMLTKDARRAVVGTLPLNRILTETDGPFTSTLNQPAKPADVALVLRMLQPVFGIDEEELRKQIVANLDDLERD